jgi:hypothetical protein
MTYFPLNYEPTNGEKHNAIAGGHYFIRPWASSNQNMQDPWDAWFEVLDKNRSTLLLGPISAGVFDDGREAVRMAELAASRYLAEVLLSRLR